MLSFKAQQNQSPPTADKWLSLFAEDADGLDTRSAIGRDNSGEDTDEQKQKSDGGKGQRIRGTHTVNERRHNAAERESGGEAKDDADTERLQSVGKDHLHNVLIGSAKGHANADFADAAANGVGEHAVDPNGGKNQCK